MKRLPRVLFLSPGIEEYLADGLFHGLRTLLGANAVDYPKHELLYDTCPERDIRRIRGHGMTLYGLLPDLGVSRARVWDELRRGEFDVAVFADATRRFGAYVELLPALGSTRVALVDGDDAEWLYPYGGRWWRRRAWWMLPRPRREDLYFKRELTGRTLSYRTYRLLPSAVAARVVPTRNLRPLSYSIPAEKIVAAAPPKDRLLASHVVDEDVARRVGARSDYVFTREDEYYADLRRARFAVTTRRAGWDCLRHYEIAANGCVPCFRDLDRKPATCAPHGLDETNCVSYHDADELLARIESMDDAEYARLQSSALAWARANTTVERARGLLRELGFDVASALADEDRVHVREVA